MKRFLLTVACSLMWGLASWAQLPKADVLDIVFHDDGTVTDASPMQNPVTVLGAPRIEKSTQFDMNVLCQTDEDWGEPSPNYVRIGHNDQMEAAIADGVTFETMVRPYFAGGEFNRTWVNLFGGFQSGGIGLIIYDGLYDFEMYVDGRYYDIMNDTQPVADKWVHLMGVWNKEEGAVKLFIDGQLAGSASGVTGNLGFANSDARFYGVGCDFDPGYETSNSSMFAGDIALARIYDKPLSDEEVAAVYADVQAKKKDVAEHSEEVTLRKAEDGTVLIASTEELNAFGRAVRQGQRGLNARLEAHVEYAGRVKMLSTAMGYAGTFDGQGHAITVGINRDTNNAGLFYCLNGATVKDLTIKGQITTSGKFAGGLAARASGTNRVDRVTSSVHIISNIEGDGTHGGLFGAPAGTLTIDHCLFDGSIEGAQTTSCAGFVGWSSASTTIRNSLLMAEISTSEEASYTFARNPGNVRVTNCYYVEPFGEVDDGCTQVDGSQLVSGEVCWLLNGQRPGTDWRQTLPDDEVPTLNAGHGVVVGTDNAYMSIQDEASLKATAEAFAGTMRQKADEQLGYAPLIDKLKADIDLLAAPATLDDFLNLNKTVEDDFAAIATNLEAYGELTKAVENALNELGELDNPVAQMLRAYLTDYTEPDETFPNGSYTYILENYTLSTEQIQSEIQYIADMLQKAMTNDIPAGTDITLLMTNPDFGQGDEGWEGTNASNYTSNPNSGQWYGPTEAYKYQTLTGLKNGIYEFQLNALDMVGDDNYCAFYTAVIQANGMEIPVMSPMEDPISVDDAVEGVNCYSNDRIVDEMYRIPYSRYGGAVAFAAGRYLNRTLVEVTDGTLTVGIRLYGSGQLDDWVMFANAKLFYQGSLDEADEALDRVLANAIARAETTIAYEGDAGGRNYLFQPNYSMALREAMEKAVADAEAASTTQEKYAALKRFSDLFNEIYTCRKAYRQLAIDLINYYDRITDYPDYIDIIEQQANEAWIGWMDGTYNAEEALAKGKALLAEMDSYSIEMPVADLLDVVFNADGTATDVSPANNEIVTIGRPKVLHSKSLDMDVFCHTQTTWGETPANYFRVMMTEALAQGITDGMAMELFARPYWTDEDNTNSWCSVLGHEEGGGMGMLVYNNQWTFEAHIGGSYNDAFSGSAPKMGEWTHIVGVWDQESGSLLVYVNGEFAGSANGSGDYRQPNIPEKWFGIGCDPNGNGEASASFKGDIAIARIYNQPINGSQAALLYKKAKALFTGEEEHTEGTIEHKGTKDDPYEIATAEEFVDLHNKMHTGETTYVKLTDDIDMSGVSDWICLNDASNIAQDKGWMNWIDFDGQGHVIRNFTSTTATGYAYASVFGVLCGNVRNVGFENVNVDCTDTGSGVLGGYMGHNNFTDENGVKMSSTLENVWVTGKLNVSTSYCGGLIGNIGGPSTIKNCYTNLEITSDASYVGGIVGRVRDALTVENVYAAGTMNKGGGIVGGGQNESTPASTYTNCVVWNNATEFGTTAAGDVVSGSLFYDGTNFAALQQAVVAWGAPWTCDMAEGSYPTFNKDQLTGIQQIAERPRADIYMLDGRLVKANAADVKSLPRGIYIINGKKVMVR